MDPIGEIKAPVDLGGGSGLDPIVKLMNVGLNIILIVAAIWALINFIIAGYKYITASGDTKNVIEANKKMTFTVVGLVIIFAAPVIAAIIGLVFFGDATAILNPKIKGI